MDKLAERIGLYDIWVVFFPGASSSLISLVLLGVYKRGIKQPLAFIPSDISGWIAFIIYSILLGIVLQELGRKIEKLFNLHDSANGLLDDKKGVFSVDEISTLKTVYKRYGYKDINNSKRLFHLLNLKAIENGIAQRYVKLSVLSQMALSLAAMMIIELIECLFFIIYSIIKNISIPIMFFIIICIISLTLFVVFLKRSTRFNRYWVRNIVYAIANKQGEKKENE